MRRRQERHRPCYQLCAYSVALFALFNIACDAPTAARPTFAYDPTTLSRGLLYRWPSGSKIAIWVDLAASPEGSGPLSLALAVREGIATWNRVPLFAEYTLVHAESVADANVIVFDRATSLPIAPGDCTFDGQNSAGYTYFCPVGSSPFSAQRFTLASGAASQATVIIRVDRGRVTDQRAYSNLIVHELGHALGIGAHSDQATDVMFGAPRVGTLSKRDIQTLRYVLGQRADITL